MLLFIVHATTAADRKLICVMKRNMNYFQVWT